MSHQNDLLFACSLNDLAGAVGAIARGASPDQPAPTGLSPLQVCLRGPNPAMAIDLQGAVEARLGLSPWRGRDGQNAMTMIAMSGSGALMREAASRLPHAVFDRDFDGLNSFDLFCEQRCASGASDPHAEIAAEEIGRKASDLALKSAIGSCLRGLETGRDLARHAGEANPILSILRSLLLARELERETAAGEGKRQGGHRL